MTDDVLEELASLPTFHHPAAAPDGDAVALYYDLTGRNELHVYDPATGDHERWSDGQVPRNARWHLRWSAGGDRVYFHRDRGGDEQNDLYAIDADGDVDPVVEAPGQNVLMAVGEDDRTLVVGSTRDGQMNLYRHDLSEGETTRITDYDRATHGATLSPDCSRVAYSTNETDVFDNVDAYVADVDGSDARRLDVGETGAEAGVADWGPDGDRLLVADNSTDYNRCGVYDLSDDAVRWYGPSGEDGQNDGDDGDDEDGDARYEESPVAFLPGGDRFLATRTRRAAVAPVVYDLDGESRELDLPEGVASFPGAGDPVLSDRAVLVTHTTPTDRPELLVYDLATDEARTLVDAEYGDVDPDRFADAEYFRFDSDGVPETPARAVDHDPYEQLAIGALLYDSGERPSPLVVNPHGGPRAADYRSFDLYTQFLVSRGYSVLQVNYRGSTGRGLSFVEQLYDDWGGAEQGDVAVAAERVIDREWVDEDRVVVFGGSYGGYSAYWQVLQYPELYDAGVAWIGVSDLPDMYENTMPHFRTELMERYLGTPEAAPDLYERRSPTTHAANLDCPLMVVHGVNDRRVPVSQARLFRERLEEAGYRRGEDGDFEYVELGEEGHASSDIDQKIRFFELLDDFLARRVGAGDAGDAGD